ncbi:MAG: SOS response-associated peptidase [Ardenticatenaceae bacterium]|nr:SOS response-associated peptidase [Ardenticatenaceae bacterium]HBY94887.1 hypothetical protein [Chloroflexota bacterium]
MCGRFTLTTSVETLVESFELSAAPPELPPRYNIAPTQPVAAVLGDDEEQRRLALLRWGLIPAWAKDPGIGNRMINARAETVAEKPAYRAAFQRRRCLVVADGFYEWQRLERGKRPIYIRMADGQPFAFAGLWEHWQGPDGSPIDSCTILTTTPNEIMYPIHNRMPVILLPEAYDLWLDPSVQAAGPLLPLLRPYPAEAMTAFPVSPLVNNPANDDPRCIVPLDEHRV